MDLDALAAARHDDWQRLDVLARQRRLAGPETDELIERYQAGASDLSLVKSTAGSTALGDRLSISLARARLKFTGAPENPLRQLSRFAGVSLPAALYRLRWLTLAVAVATFVIAGLYAWWISGDPRAIAALGSEGELEQLAEEGFVAYYSENPAASFAGMVWTNNAWIAAQCVAFGVLGVWVPWVILQNAQNLGVTAAVMFAYDEADTFFLYIAPHGLLELTCVFVAAAAGLRIFWAWVAPGATPPRHRPRRRRPVAVHGRDRARVLPLRRRPHRGLRDAGTVAVGGEDRHRRGSARRIPRVHARARRSCSTRRRDRRPRRVRRGGDAGRRRLSSQPAGSRPRTGDDVGFAGHSPIRRTG